MAEEENELKNLI